MASIIIEKISINGIRIRICIFIIPNLKYKGKNIELKNHIDVKTEIILNGEIDILYIERPAVFPIKPIKTE